MLLAEQGNRSEQRQALAVKQLSELLQNGMTQLQKQVGEHLGRYSEELGKRIDGLTLKTDERLKEISGHVEKRLTEGFEKTTQTFGDILKRLALIDEAQKRITELSTNVVSLQEVLADKRSRGAFGEVQLEALVRNVLPEQAFAFQKKLSNDKVADCVLSLPPPTGNVAIDAKFPLESWRRMTDVSVTEPERKVAEKQFRQDIVKHITDISEKYILPGETSDGAIMFIPAEAIFAEIHGHYPDLVERAMTARVWMVSPTTLWATLNMARAVLKDGLEEVAPFDSEEGFLAIAGGRSDVRAQEREIESARQEVRLARGAFYPSAGFLGNYYAKRVGTQRNIDWDALFSVDLPLFQGGTARALVREAGSRLKESELRLQELRRDIRREVREAARRVNASVAGSKRLRSAFEKAAESYRLQVGEYRLGLVNNLEVLQVMNDMQDRKRDLDRALIESKVHWLELKTAAEDLPEAQ